MVYHRTLPFFCLLLLCLAGLQGCAKDELIENPPSPDKETTDRIWGTLEIGETDLTPDVFLQMLQDDEPPSVLFDNSRRGFRVNQPLQVSINERQELFVRFYSPRPIRQVTVWATIGGYEETFRLATFEVIPAFTEFHKELPMLTESKYYLTRTGKKIQIMANPHLSAADFKLEVECEDAYYRKLLSTQSKYNVRFSAYSQEGSWKFPLLPAHAREAVALMLNYGYMFSSQEFAEELEKYRGKLHSDANKTVIDIDMLRRRVINHSGFVIGKVTSVDGLGGGETYGLNEWCFLEHYADDGAQTGATFHELGHCLGYGHSGNMTYEQTGKGWITLCATVYNKLCIEKKLPVYSRRFMHTRRYGKLYGSSQYMRSRYVIEDPELDAIDGGLSPALKEDDENTGEGTPLSCSITYKDIPDATESTFTPKDVCVRGNRIYIVNNAAGHFSLEVLEEQNGKLAHIKTLKEWTEGGEKKGFAATPNGVTAAHGKIYVTNEQSRTDVFDEKTFELLATIGTGAWGEGSNQTVHAFDVLVYRGCVFVRDKRRVCVFLEDDIVPGTSFKNVPNYCRTSNLGEAMGTYGQAIGADGLLYATHQGNKKIHVFDPQTMREQAEWKAQRVIDLASYTPYDVAFAGKRMFVSFATSNNQRMALAEVSPETGVVVKDYTTAGSHNFNKAEKMCVSRQTLFVVDRATHSVTGIPVEKLN